jgi:REP element-mobilizing transposase RayT
MQPWNDWYHCMCSTYGTWLRGDARGWRTRHHREHVEGNYKDPPAPGTFENTLRRSRDLLKHAATHLAPDQRQIALDVIVQTFQFHGLDLIAICLDDHHLHLLARFRDHNPRKWVGISKKRAARALSDAGFVDEGGVWGKRSQCQPIRDRAHQVATFRYILNHASRGAATWRLPYTPNAHG